MTGPNSSFCASWRWLLTSTIAATRMIRITGATQNGGLFSRPIVEIHAITVTGIRMSSTANRNSKSITRDLNLAPRDLARLDQG